MDKDKVVRFETQASVVTEGRLSMGAILRQGAQRMLQQAIENEVEEFLACHATALIDAGRRAVVRNGSLPPRKILTAMGSLEV